MEIENNTYLKQFLYNSTYMRGYRINLKINIVAESSKRFVLPTERVLSINLINEYSLGHDNFHSFCFLNQDVDIWSAGRGDESKHNVGVQFIKRLQHF